MTINTHDLGRANRRFSIGVLMTVEKPSGSSFGDIAVEGREPDMNVVVAVMGESRRVMGNENVYFGKVEQQRFDFLLLKKEVALGLVFPRPAEAAKGQTAKLKCSQVQVIYRFGEFGAGIMIALHGEDVATSAFLGNVQNDRIGEVTAANKNVCARVGHLMLDCVIISNHQESHCTTGSGAFSFVQAAA